jgi:hypothetical protein
VRPYLVVASLALALVALWAFGRSERAKGAAQAEVRRLTHENSTLRTRAAVARVVFVRDTVRVVKSITRWETVRDSVFATDTLRRTDTAFVTLAATADTAIRACRSVVRSCGAALALSDSLLANREALIRAMKRQQPSALDKARTALVFVAAGYLAGRFTR